METKIKDILKRLYQIENCLLQMTDIIDIARNYDERLTKLEKGVKAMKLESEALQKAKIDIIQRTNAFYMQFTNHIRGLPIDNAIKCLCLQYLDTGLLWAIQGIKSSNIEIVNKGDVNNGKGNEQENREKCAEESSGQGTCREKVEDAETCDPA